LTVTDSSNPSELAKVAPDSNQQQPTEVSPASSPSLPAEAASLPGNDPTAPLAPSSGAPDTNAPDSDAAGSNGPGARKRILIGSQRDPAAYRVRPRHDWAPLDESDEKPAEEGKPSGRRHGRHRHGDRQEGRHFGPSPAGHNRHPDAAAPAGTGNRGEGTAPVESGNSRELTPPGAVPVPASPAERRPTFASPTAAAQAAPGVPPSEL